MSRGRDEPFLERSNRLSEMSGGERLRKIVYVKILDSLRPAENVDGWRRHLRW